VIDHKLAAEDTCSGTRTGDSLGLSFAFSPDKYFVTCTVLGQAALGATEYTPSTADCMVVPSGGGLSEFYRADQAEAKQCKVTTTKFEAQGTNLKIAGSVTCSGTLKSLGLGGGTAREIEVKKWIFDVLL
jgi:hypothetical protein